MLRRTGSPHAWRLAVTFLWTWLLMVWAANAVRVIHAAEPERPTLLLRMEFGGRGPRSTWKVWSGEVRIGAGRVVAAQALDIEADTPGSLLVLGDRVLIRQRSPRGYSGLDIRVEADLEEELSVELTGRDAPPVQNDRDETVSRTIRLKLRQLLAGQLEWQLDGNNHLLVSRPPSDTLRLELDRSHLIFEPGETLSGTLIAPLLSGLDRAAEVRWQLLAARGGKVLNSGQIAKFEAGQRGPVSLPIDIPLPRQEGVYNFSVSLVVPGRGVFPAEPLHVRRVQFVVLSSKAPKTAAQDEPSPEIEPTQVLVDQIDPTSRRLWFRKPLSHGAMETVQTPLGRFLELRAQPDRTGQRSDQESWVAYYLRVKHLRRAHLLEVSYPEDRKQVLALRIVEPNPAGQVVSVGLESGVYTGDPGEVRASVGKHALLFWPQSTSPMVLLTNLTPGGPARFGMLQLYEVRDDRLQGEQTVSSHDSLGWSIRQTARRAMRLPEPGGERPVTSAGSEAGRLQSPDDGIEQVESARKDERVGVQAAGKVERIQSPVPVTSDPAAAETSNKDTGAATAPALGAGVARRLFGPYLNKPLFPENFGGSERLDDPSRRSLDDWQTFWEGAHRLVGYLKRQGHNSLLLAVLADGSTIYPSALLEPTPRYDTGIFSAGGHDPMRKDVLELLFRLFDREGLVLIPELQFTSPLPELERRLFDSQSQGGEGQQSGIRLLGRDGLPQITRYGSDAAPYYNPLDVQVQQAIKNVVEELVARYGGHASFGGVAVQLTGWGFAQFPGPEWGYDAETRVRFSSETKIVWQGSGRRGEPVSLSTEPQWRAWLHWRADQLAHLYGAVYQIVQQHRPEARLYLTTTHALVGGRDAGGVYSAIRQGKAPADLLLERGIDPSLTEHAGIVWLRPAQQGPLAVRASSALDEDLAYSPELDQLYATAAGPAGSLFFHRPHAPRLVGFERKSPWRETYLKLRTSLLPSGNDNRRRFAHALATLDSQVLFDGGWLIPMGHEASLDALTQAFTALPAAPFRAVGEELGMSQPVMIRQYSANGTTYLYLVNDSPWEVAAVLNLNCPPKTKMTSRGTSTPEEFGGAAGAGLRLRCRLGAYGLCMLTLAVAQLDVLDVFVEVPTQVRSELEAEVASVERRLAAVPGDAEQNRVARLLRNGNFESGAAAPAELEGWTFDANGPDGGAELDSGERHSGGFSLRCTAGGTLRCEAFATPQRSYLGYWVWLRSDRDGASVRLGLEGATAQGTYARTSEPPLRLTRQWRRYLFRVLDIPFDAVNQMQVRFEFETGSTVWVDDVELLALPLKQEEKMELGQAATSARLFLEKGKVSDCRRLLNRYWVRFANQYLPDPQAARVAAESAVLTQKQRRRNHSPNRR